MVLHNVKEHINIEEIAITSSSVLFGVKSELSSSNFLNF